MADDMATFGCAQTAVAGYSWRSSRIAPLLIALADWIKYKCRIGCYSDQALTELGAFRAMPEMYSDFAVNLVDGDRLFVHSRGSFIGWAIMYLTHGPWNHVGMLTARGTVWEAIGSGVDEYPLEKYFDGQQYLLVLRLPLTPDQQQALKAGYDAEKGKPYAYRKIFRLFVLTLVNEHADYRFTFTLDIIIGLTIIWVLVPFHPVKIATAVIGALYLIVLGVNSLIRLSAALRLYKDYLEYASPQAFLPINSSPNRFFRFTLRLPGVGCLSRRGNNHIANTPSSGLEG